MKIFITYQIGRRTGHVRAITTEPSDYNFLMDVFEDGKHIQRHFFKDISRSPLSAIVKLIDNRTQAEQVFQRMAKAMTSDLGNCMRLYLAHWSEEEEEDEVKEEEAVWEYFWGEEDEEDEEE